MRTRTDGIGRVCRGVVVGAGVGLGMICGVSTVKSDELPAGYERLPDDIRDGLIKEGLGEDPFLVIGIKNNGETVTFVPSNVDILPDLTVKFGGNSNQLDSSASSFLLLRGSKLGLHCGYPPGGGSPVPCRGLQQKNN